MLAHFFDEHLQLKEHGWTAFGQFLINQLFNLKVFVMVFNSIKAQWRLVTAKFEYSEGFMDSIKGQVLRRSIHRWSSPSKVKSSENRVHQRSSPSKVKSIKAKVESSEI
jgi:hypothetical protein